MASCKYVNIVRLLLKRGANIGVRHEVSGGNDVCVQ